ncbi:hypothetical protein BWI17_03785 [Betaproteobacteria bacterium GR16-43]|nr:hypothetical protein BWI17_03785 [Betaproteobacteria bacterium GR16-43]
MALRSTIARNVSASQVASKAPREFVPYVDAHRLIGGPYTVITFPGMRGESSSIVDTPTMSKALEKTGTASPIVVIAHDFTAEVRAQLGRLNVIFFFRRDSGWTDESWRTIRDKEYLRR